MRVQVTFPDFSASREAGAGPVFTCKMHANDVGPTWVDVAGDLDIASAPRLGMALALTDPRRLVILNLRGLSFLDSSGVHVIAEASARARQANGWFVLIRGCPQVDRMLTLSGASDVLNIVDLDLDLDLDLDRPVPAERGVLRPLRSDGEA